MLGDSQVELYLFKKTASSVSFLQGLGYWYCPGQSSPVVMQDPQSPRRSGPLTRLMPGIHYRGDSSSSLDNSLGHSSRRPLVFIHGVGFGIVGLFTLSARL